MDTNEALKEANGDEMMDNSKEDEQTVDAQDKKSEE